jgi:hypothetical protein
MQLGRFRFLRQNWLIRAHGVPAVSPR